MSMVFVPFSRFRFQRLHKPKFNDKIQRLGSLPYSLRSLFDNGPDKRSNVSNVISMGKFPRWGREKKNNNQAATFPVSKTAKKLIEPVLFFGMTKGHHHHPLRPGRLFLLRPEIIYYFLQVFFLRYHFGDGTVITLNFQ